MNDHADGTAEIAGREPLRLVEQEVQPLAEQDPQQQAMREKLVIGARGYIIKVARQIAPGASAKQRAELVEWGEDGARIATRSYDPAKGKFLTYATPFIHGEMQDGLTRKYRDVNLARAARILASELLGEPPDMDASWDTDEAVQERLHRVTSRCIIALLACIATAPRDPEQALINEELTRIVDEVFATVIPARPQREQKFWALRFQQGWLLEAIEKALGVSTSTVYRIQEDLFDALYLALHEHGVLEEPHRRP